MVGDFNETSDQDAILHLTRESGLRDAWEVAGDGTPGWTYSRRNPYVRSRPDAADVRIDYIFVGSGEARIEGCRVVGDRLYPDDLPPTDHFGLVATLVLP
jgi:endonuclease/exonuclease/phosphatase family metal-dependent hydrolase